MHFGNISFLSFICSKCQKGPKQKLTRPKKYNREGEATGPRQLRILFYRYPCHCQYLATYFMFLYLVDVFIDYPVDVYIDINILQHPIADDYYLSKQIQSLCKNSERRGFKDWGGCALLYISEQPTSRKWSATEDVVF